MEKQDKMGRWAKKSEFEYSNQKKAGYISQSKNSPLDLRPPQVLQKDINAKAKNIIILGLR